MADWSLYDLSLESLLIISSLRCAILAMPWHAPKGQRSDHPFLSAFCLKLQSQPARYTFSHTTHRTTNQRTQDQRGLKNEPAKRIASPHTHTHTKACLVACTPNQRMQTPTVPPPVFIVVPSIIPHEGAMPIWHSSAQPHPPTPRASPPTNATNKQTAYSESDLMNSATST